MDENRFSYKQHYNAPLMIGEAFDGNKKLTVQEMVDLLNKLSEENRELRKELGDCEKFRYTVFKRLNDEYIKERSIK